MKTKRLKWFKEGEAIPADAVFMVEPSEYYEYRAFFDLTEDELKTIDAHNEKGNFGPSDPHFINKNRREYRAYLYEVFDEEEDVGHSDAHEAWLQRGKELGFDVSSFIKAKAPELQPKESSCDHAFESSQLAHNISKYAYVCRKCGFTYEH